MESYKHRAESKEAWAPLLLPGSSRIQSEYLLNGTLRLLEWCGSKELRLNYTFLDQSEETGAFVPVWSYTSDLTRPLKGKKGLIRSLHLFLQVSVRPEWGKQCQCALLRIKIAIIYRVFTNLTQWLWVVEHLVLFCLDDAPQFKKTSPQYQPQSDRRENVYCPNMVF